MTLRTFVAPAMLTLMTACAPAVQHPSNILPDDAGTVAIDVANDHWSAITVFVVRGSERRRLGDVNGSATLRFYLPARLFDGPSVRLRVEPGDLSMPYDSEPLIVSPGQRIVFQVGQDVAASSRIR